MKAELGSAQKETVLSPKELVEQAKLCLEGVPQLPGTDYIKSASAGRNILRLTQKLQPKQPTNKDKQAKALEAHDLPKAALRAKVLARTGLVRTKTVANPNGQGTLELKGFQESELQRGVLMQVEGSNEDVYSISLNVEQPDGQVFYDRYIFSETGLIMFERKNSQQWLNDPYPQGKPQYGEDSSRLLADFIGGEISAPV